MNTLLQLLKYEWKAVFRSPVLHKNILVNVFMVLSMLYVAANLLVLGFLLDDILMNVPMEAFTYKSNPSDWVLRRFNSLLLYYFLLDFGVRYMMQKLPALAIQPLLHLPIKKGTLIHYMLSKTLFAPFNFFQFLLLIPFMNEVFGNLDSSSAALSWVVSISCVILTINFLAVYLKRSADMDWRIYATVVLVLASIASLSFFGVVDGFHISALFFNALIDFPILVIIPISLLGLSYFINYRFLKYNLYLSKISKSDNSSVSYKGSGWLSQFGITGKLTELELKFIFRNKRSKMVFWSTGLFLLYGLFVFTQEETANQPLLVLLTSILITGMFMINYGQFLLGWDGTFFDHVLTRRVSFQDYYRGKFLVFAIMSSISMILSIPYVYFGTDVLLILFCSYLFNMGVSAHLIMFFGSFNPKKIDISQSSMMNWQGASITQFLMVIPAFGVPIGLYAVLNLFTNSTTAIIGVGAAGFIGILGTNIWVKLLANWLKNRRYEIAADFRNS